MVSDVNFKNHKQYKIGLCAPSTDFFALKLAAYFITTRFLGFNKPSVCDTQLRFVDRQDE